VQVETLKSTELFDIRIDLGEAHHLGLTPAGERRVVPVVGGSFSGSRLRGVVLPGDADWVVMRPDGVLVLDVRITLRTDDGALIAMTYRGLRHGPDAVLARLRQGEPVDHSEYYFRTVPVFETGAERYRWLNRIIAVGIGRREPEAVHYSVLEIL
jgi:hypothetical protein